MAVLLAFLIFLSIPHASAAAAVSYSISPASGSVKPSDTVNVLLSVKTDVPIAGGGVHLIFTDGSYANFEEAGTPEISYTPYHPEENDLLFICNNNRCEPGTYRIGTIAVKAAEAGTLSVAFKPTETIDPDLNLIDATGVSGNYTISQKASPSDPKDKITTNSYAIPKDDGKGGFVPTKATDTELQQRYTQAQLASRSGSTGLDGDPLEVETKSFWSFKNLAFVGLGIGAGLGLLLFVILKFIGGGPKTPGPFGGGPSTPAGPSGPSNIVVG